MLYSLMSSISIFYSLAVEQEGILHAHASIRSTEVKIGPFASDTSPKQIDREGLGKLRTGTRFVDGLMDLSICHFMLGLGVVVKLMVS